MIIRVSVVLNNFWQSLSSDVSTTFVIVILSYVQTDATTPNIVGSCCVRLHGDKSLTGFKLCATTPNNMQQHATGCANGRNMWRSTMLGVVGQQCCVRLHGQVNWMSWITSVAGTILKTLNQCPWYVSIGLLTQFNKISVYCYSNTPPSRWQNLTKTGAILFVFAFVLEFVNLAGA